MGINRGATAIGPDHIVDTMIALSGQFDEKIKELGTAKKDAEPYLQIVANVDEAREIKARAVEEERQMQAALDERTAALDRRESALVEREAAAAERERVATEHEAAIDAAQAKLEADTIEYQRMFGARREVVEGLEAGYASKEATLNAKIEDGYSAIALVRKKLDADREALDADIARHAQDHGEAMERVSEAERAHQEKAAAFEEEKTAAQVEIDGLQRDLREKLSA